MSLRLPVLLLALAAAPLAVPTAAADQLEPELAPLRETRPLAVDLALCLDTSGSMEGLIDSARQKLWSVVSELASARPTPVLRVALLTYGSPGDAEAGYVVLRTGLTADLDLVSERLFALGTSGGDEYVGRVVGHALDRLAWTDGPALKIVFVAGNESADQDVVRPFRAEARRALASGVIVNAVYCGGADDGDASGWRELAALGKGRFASIDKDDGTVALVTPFDEELAKLSGRMNATYVAYGEAAKEARERQAAQDANALAAGAPAAAERAAAKAGLLYVNSAWDLVDRMAEEGFDLATVKDEELPEELRALSLEQRKEHLAAKKAEREAVRARIQELDAKRKAYVLEEMAERRLDDGRALDRALRDAIREQAGSRGVEFPEKDAPPSK
jgi:hypothetical protein